jgi:sulfate adenylyltransferase
MSQQTIFELIQPVGGSLVNLLVPAEERDEMHSRATTFRTLQLSERSSCDLELLATGGFSPLNTFLGQADHQRVLSEMRLANGQLWPIPITLPISADTEIGLDEEIALRNNRGEILATMVVEEIYPWDRDEEARQTLGTNDPRHPLVAEMHRWGLLNISGRIRVLQLPRRYDFSELRLTPQQTRARLEALGHPNVVAFQTRNPLHRAHEEITKRAIKQVDGTLLLHPAVGMTKPGDIDHYTRVRTYKALADNYYDRDRIVLALLPLAMRLAGPKEALWHALIRRNYGANHLIVGRDHASPGVDSNGNPFYGPYAAQELVAAYSAETGVQMMPFREVVYLPEEDRYEESSRVSDSSVTASISGTEVREKFLELGKPLPEWFTRREVAEILAASYPERHRRGICIWFTGLSGAGKSTTAEVLTVLFQEYGRQVTLLDGDVVRTNLSRGLGFTKEDRDLNIRRIGFVASEIVRHGGVAICAAVSPYRATRNDVRNMVGVENFVEVFVDTPLAECERRDTKGMYARARRGEIKNFTGVDDPYEPPESPELTLETMSRSAEENARWILDYLIGRGFIRR